MATILCADDDVRMQNLYETILTAKDHLVVLVSNGREAVGFLDSTTSVDLMVLDINMPIMNGLEACQEVRRHAKGFDMPIIIVSANDTEEDIVDGLSMGADEYIIKPFKPAELLGKVAMALKRRKGGRADMGIGPGSRFAGKYDLDFRIGEGGHGVVYFAIDTTRTPQLGVALKVYDLPPSKRNDKQFVSMFLREAYMHSRLDHPNIIKLFDFGHTDNTHYLAMEFIDGMSMEEFVHERGPMAEEQLKLVTYEIVKALDYLDRQGIVHRDIKPANILLSNAGDVKLGDFGLARQSNEHTLSLEEEFKGTPQFVAPETISGIGEQDLLSDVYSLGATLHYTATGKPPFPGNTTLDILNAHFDTDPTPVCELNGKVSREFSDLISMMMKRDKIYRPSALELLSLLGDMIE
jgi:CheY-like chemotaxis protein